jgi:hypothetical protein
VRPLDIAFIVVLAIGYWPVLAGADARSIYMISGGLLLSFLVASLVSQATWGLSTSSLRRVEPAPSSA